MTASAPVSQEANTLRSAALVLTSVWALAMISIPILRWVLGDDALPVGVWVTVSLQAAATVTALAAVWGVSRALGTAALLVVLGWLVEFVGSQSGIPFGTYLYTEALQPQIGDVPVVIPVAWLMMLPTAWAISERIVGRSRPLVFAFVAALAFTAWDLFLDPQMVNWGYWNWQRPGGYFGIPWVNYLGWVGSALLFTWLVRPGPLPQPEARPLIILYTVTWLLQSVGLALFWGLIGPAAVGFVVMGAFVLLAWFGPIAQGNHRTQPGSPPASNPTPEHR
jgi:lycopene beta-cyclase